MWEGNLCPKTQCGSEKQINVIVEERKQTRGRVEERSLKI